MCRQLNEGCILVRHSAYICPKSFLNAPKSRGPGTAACTGLVYLTVPLGNISHAVGNDYKCFLCKVVVETVCSLKLHFFYSCQLLAHYINTLLVGSRHHHGPERLRFPFFQSTVHYLTCFSTFRNVFYKPVSH